MSTRDVRDIMGLPTGIDAPKPVIAKRAKPTGPRQKGINRELLALHGERAPPVSIIDSGKQYRAKIHRDFKPSHWENTAFGNGARSDGLQLRHWRKRKPISTEVAMDQDNKEDGQLQPEPEKEYEFARYNISVTVPTYTDEQYDAHLTNDDWSKAETDYLLDLVKSYNQRWAVVVDRYEWAPPMTEDTEDNTTSIAKASDVRSRKLEALKARYYQVWAKSIELAAGGQKNMSETEFALHEQLLKYNPTREEQRKELAWQLAKRAPDDVREEEFLLSELQRIMISAQKFETERHEVRERLEMAQHIGSGTNAFTSATSTALNQLYAQLAAQDRTRKARHRLSLNVSDINTQTPGPQTAQTPNTATATASASAHRDSVSGSGQRRGTATNIQPPQKTLSPANEVRYGVTTHDRLTSGVSFRSDKLLKLRQAKSQIQTQKIGAALAELQVPEVLVLPTTRVCDAFEGLVSRISKLVEARKLLEKEEQELRVAVNIKEEKEGKSTEAGAEGEGQDAEMKDDEIEAKDADGEEDDADGEADDAEAKDEEADEDEGGDGNDDAEEEDEEQGEEELNVDDDDDEPDADGETEGPTPRPAAADDSEPATRPSSSRSNIGASHKRSASVLSAASSKASRSSKRTRR